MAPADLLLVGIADPRLAEILQRNGYHCTTTPDIASIVPAESSWAMLLVDARLIDRPLDAIVEQLYFLNNNGPIALCVDDPGALSPKLLNALRLGTLECLYYAEVNNGLFLSRIDRVLLNHRLSNALSQRQETQQEKEQLQRELMLRDKVVDHERDLNANIIASIASGVIILDSAGLVVLMNEHARGLLGVAAGAAVGAHFGAVLPDELCSLIRKFTAKAGPSGCISEVERMRQKERFLQVSAYTMLDSRLETAGGLLLFVQDITEQEQTAVQLYQAEKLATVGTMLSGIAHELRNPLAIISARSQRAIARKDLDLPTAVKAFESIEDQTERCAHIVNSLLDFTRNRATMPRYHKIAEILDETLTYVEYQHTFDNIRVIKNYQPDLEVFGDRSRFVQVFLNIITNAADAMDGRGNLRLTTTEAEPDFSIVEVNDSGSGIEQTVMHKIFDPFFTTKDPGKGTGLGLAIVRKVVQESGGHVLAHSQPGSTSLFVKLPRTKERLHG